MSAFGALLLISFLPGSGWGKPAQSNSGHTPSLASETMATPEEDDVMLSGYRAEFLLDVGMLDDYELYLNPQRLEFPRQTGITVDDLKRKWIFGQAVQKIKLAMLGTSVRSPQAERAAGTGLRTAFARIFRSLVPGGTRPTQGTMG